MFFLLTSLLRLFSLCCLSLALLEFIFLFFLCRWLRSVLSSLCPLLSFFPAVALPFVCSGFPVSLNCSVLLPLSLGFLFCSLWCFCLGVLFFLTCWDPLFGVPVSVFVCRLLRRSLVSFRIVCLVGASLSPLHLPMAMSVPSLRASLSFEFSHLSSARVLGPFFFLFFGLVFFCCCSVPAVFGTMLAIVFHVSSLGPCLLGFLRFVSLSLFSVVSGGLSSVF